MKTLWLNGEFIPEERASISVHDRGFLYGDGLFETLRVYQGQPFRWDQHWTRLRRGARFLKLDCPYASERLVGAARELLARHEKTEAVLRLQLTRGPGPRGYSPRGAGPSTLVMTVHELPPVDVRGEAGWALAASSYRLAAADPLAPFKTIHKLVQVLARAEADEKGAREAILRTPDGRVVEATSANVFWVKNDRVFTPPLADGPLPGITRAVVFELCQALSFPCQETSATMETLIQADAIFLTSSVWEIIEVARLEGKPFAPSAIVARLVNRYRTVM